MADNVQSGIELVCLSSGKYILTINGKVVAKEVEFSEALKILDPGDEKGGSHEDN